MNVRLLTSLLVLPLILLAEDPAVQLQAPQILIAPSDSVEVAKWDALRARTQKIEDLAVKYLPVSMSHRFSRMGPMRDFDMVATPDSPAGTHTYTVRHFAKTLPMFGRVPAGTDVKVLQSWTLRFVEKDEALLIQMPDRRKGGKVFVPIDRFAELSREDG